MFKLELYYFDECPYCKKVLKFIKAKKVEVVLKNIHEDSDAYSHLVRVGGKSQVPCLFIDGKPMYESNDIIAWLQENITG